MERKSIDHKGHHKPSGAAVIRPELTRALFRALFEEWAQTGYAAINLERVADCPRSSRGLSSAMASATFKPPPDQASPTSAHTSIPKRVIRRQSDVRKNSP